MSYRWFYLRLVLVLSLGGLTVARAQWGGTVTKLGDSPSGSVYSYNYGYNPGWWLPGNGGYGSPNYSGVAGAYSVNGSFPAGNSFYSQTADTNVPFDSALNFSGTFTIPTGATGAFVVATRISGNAGYTTTTIDLGVSAAGSYSGPAEYAAKLTFHNPSSVPMTYKVLNGLTELDVITVPAGSTVTQAYGGLASTDNLSVVSSLDGYQFSDGVWVEAAGVTIEALVLPATGPGSLRSSNETIAGGGTPPPTLPGYVATSDPSSAPANTVPVMPNYPTGVVPSSPTTTPAIWGAATGTDLLTNSVFRQGVDKTLAQQKASSKEVVDQLKKMETDATARRAQAKDLADREKAAADASVTANSSMAGQGASAKAAAEALFGNTPSGVGYSLTSGGAPDLSVSMPSTFGGGTFNFNPFQGGLGTVAAWFRLAVQWLTIATLGAWVWMQLGQWVRGLASVQQAKGNTVAAGTGAQATALAAAGLMTVAIVAAITALLAWSFEGINLPAFVASVTTNPLATIPTGAYWMLDQVFPVATMIAALVARITFNLYAATIYAGCAAVVRFIVP